jgi:glycerophosphoryl diester phosphodiesterase
MSVPELIAHRGFASRHPENTLAAVRAALEVGARHVEVDVQLSADRVPFLFHDRELKRLCGVRGGLFELDAAQVAELSAKGEPLARLSEFVRTMAASSAHAFVELKRASIEVFGVAAVLDAVLPQLEDLSGRCTLISFDTDVLAAARGRCAHPLGPVLEAWEQREAEEVVALEPQVVFCNVRRLPRAGPLEVPGGRLAVYEIDDARRALKLHARGAALIETFAIGELLKALSPSEAER